MRSKFGNRRRPARPFPRFFRMRLQRIDYAKCCFVVVIKTRPKRRTNLSPIKTIMLSSLSTKSAPYEPSVAMMMLMLNKKNQPVLPDSTTPTFLLKKRPLPPLSEELRPSSTIAKIDQSYVDMVAGSKRVLLSKLNGGGFRMPSLQSGKKTNQVKPVSLTSFKSICYSAPNSQDYLSRELFARRLYRGGRQAIKESTHARNDFHLPSLLGKTKGDHKKPTVVKASSSLKSFRQLWSMTEDKEVAREILSRKMQKGVASSIISKPPRRHF